MAVNQEARTNSALPKKAKVNENVVADAIMRQVTDLVICLTLLSMFVDFEIEKN